jgi:REP element-mobilizing transposase RayT
VHLIFAVKYRECLIHESKREKIQKYICGIVNQDKCKVIQIYCNPDHTHILVGFRPSISISDLVRDIKSVSSKFINEQKLMRYHFNWQDGYGAFTCLNAWISGTATRRRMARHSLPRAVARGCKCLSATRFFSPLLLRMSRNNPAGYINHFPYLFIFPLVIINNGNFIQQALSGK